MLTAAQKARFDNTSPFEDLDKVLNQKVGCIKLTYDFAVNGGAVSTITLLDENGNIPVLPINTIITQAYMHTITPVISTGNNGTMALQVNAANDLLSAVDADTYPLNANHPTTLIAVGTAVTMIITTAARSVQLVIGTNAFTAGKFNVFIHFVLSDAA